MPAIAPRMGSGVAAWISRGMSRCVAWICRSMFSPSIFAKCATNVLQFCVYQLKCTPSSLYFSTRVSIR